MIILIPAFNEEECIRAVLDELMPHCKAGGHNVLIIDDGSTDCTVDRVKSHPDYPATVNLLTLPHRGKDVALWAGIEAADDEWIGMMDGDGQYDPGNFSSLLDYAHKNASDAVWGIRLQRDDSRWRLIISYAGRWAKKLILKSYAVSDPGCGMWIACKESLARAIRSCPSPAGQVHCHLADLIRVQGCKVDECPIHHRARHGGKAKFGFINRIGPGWRSLRQAVKTSQQLRS